MDEAILEHHSNVITEDDGEDTERMDFRRILVRRPNHRWGNWMFRLR